MSRLISAHKPCNDCGSSDALAEYENGTKCFSCGRWRRKKIEKSFFDKPEGCDNTKSSLLVPSNMTTRFSPKALEWLLSYNMYKDIRELYGIKMVHHLDAGAMSLTNRVFLPVCNQKGEIVSFQLRKTQDDGGPKYWTVGTRDELFYSKGHDDSKTVVLVEDIVSAIRIGEFTKTVSLLGTSTNLENILTLANKYDTIIIWMDGDKVGQKAAKRLNRKFSLMKSKVFNIVTKKDPKCLTSGEIRRTLAHYIT